LEKAKLIISLDFELHWGVFDAYDDRYNDNILGARLAIPKILELFKKYDIHATWAIVGLLFNEDKSDYVKYQPLLLPSYEDKRLNPFNCGIGEDEAADKLHYAHSIIKLIQEYPNQEIASHSYSHYYCQAKGQTIAEFEEDIKSAVNIAKDKFNINIKSFVFPKNEINQDYLNILNKYSISTYRSNPNHIGFSDKYRNTIIGKIFRILDSFICISSYDKTSLVGPHEPKGIIGNRFLRPYKNKIINIFMLRRIISEMKFSAKHNYNYHLWWHPHNFGMNLEKNLDNLECVLKEFELLRGLYNMESVCMKNCFFEKTYE
jgi:peptidoglycan/xylan/chitin deacetylase (PgdA/CDA1 family)